MILETPKSKLGVCGGKTELPDKKNEQNKKK